MKNFISLIIIVVLFPVTAFAWKMESGTIALNHTNTNPNWTTKTLDQTYDSPPLIFALASEEGGHAVALRVRNVTLTSFEMIQVEPDNFDGWHTNMTIHYFAIEEGEYTLPNGTKIIAGTHETNSSLGKNDGVTDVWDTVSFSSAFDSTPIILGMIQGMENEENNIPSENSAPWLTTAVSNVTNSNFSVSLERSETSTGSITNDETIAYLAIDSGVNSNLFDTSCNLISFETIITPENIDGWDDGCDTFSFSTYTSPRVFATKNTHNEDDGGWLRRCSINTNSIGLTVDEDTATDNERNHIGESAGILVISEDFVYDSSNLTCNVPKPVVEYRMDECYWSGTTDEVKDSSSNALDGTSYNDTQVDQTDAYIGYSGQFDGTNDYIDVDDDVLLTTTSNFTVSTVVKPETFTNTYQDIAAKTTNYNDGFVLSTYWDGSDSNVALIFLQAGDGSNNIFVSSPINANEWSHIVVSYDGIDLRLYINGIEVDTTPASRTILNASVPLQIGMGLNGDYDYNGRIDELKIWDNALTLDDISYIYDKESNERNYDGTERNEVVCGASIVANSWEMISIPQESRSPTVLGVQDVFGDDFIGANYNAGDTDGWILWRRDYNTNNNLHTYHMVDYDGNEPIDFNKGYWLGSTVDVNWSVDETQPVDYNSTYNGTSDCTSNRCVEVDLVSVQRDGLRYNLSNFPGKSAVDWADCRFIISDTDGSNVEVLTPKEADTAGYVSRIISIWPGAGQAGSGTGDQVVNGDYDECHDESVWGCDLLPYHSVWIQLLTPSLDKKIKLLIPEE